MHGHLNFRVLRSSGMLRSVDRYLFTDVSGQSLSRLQGSGSRPFILEDGTDRLSRNVGKSVQISAAWHARRAKTVCCF